jgi:hypothetical protein
MADGTEPIDPDEVIYRRLPKGSQFKPNRDPPLASTAFSPRPCDHDGVSLVRAKYVTGPEDAAALGVVGMEFYVIEMRAGDLMAEGIAIEPLPSPECLGHAVMPAINADNKDNPQTQALMDRARRVSFKAHGLFPGKCPPKAQP